MMKSLFMGATGTKIQQAQPTTDGLIAHYPLKQNSNDNFVNQYDGTDYNVAYDGQSAIFDGNDSFINLTNINMENSTKLSLSIWVKLSSDFQQQHIFSKYSTESNRFTLYASNIGTSSERLAFGGQINGGNWTYACHTGANDSVGLIADNTWKHIVIMVDADEYTNNSIFINMVDNTDYTASLNPMLEINGDNINIGYDSLNANYIYGNITNFRIYDRLLSEEEIEIIYNQEKGDFGL